MTNETTNNTVDTSSDPDLRHDDVDLWEAREQTFDENIISLFAVTDEGSNAETAILHEDPAETDDRNEKAWYQIDSDSLMVREDFVNREPHADSIDADHGQPDTAHTRRDANETKPFGRETSHFVDE